MERCLITAGQRVWIRCSVPALVPAIEELLPQTDAGLGRDDADVVVEVEPDPAPFDVDDGEQFMRRAWRTEDGVVLANGYAGRFDVRVRMVGRQPEFTFRWRAGRVQRRRESSRAGRRAARAMLVHQPAMWWAGTQRCAPVRGIGVPLGSDTVVLLSGAGDWRVAPSSPRPGAGVPRHPGTLWSTDGRTVWPIADATPDGAPIVARGGRLAAAGDDGRGLRPSHLVVLRRTGADDSFPRICPPSQAVRALVAGTYMADELRRYWPFAAALSAGTGVGPVLPPVHDVVDELARHARCLEASSRARAEQIVPRVVTNPDETTRVREENA